MISFNSYVLFGLFEKRRWYFF